MSNASHAINVPEDSREAVIKRFTAELTGDKSHKHGKRVVIAEVDGMGPRLFSRRCVRCLWCILCGD
jgi:hypothetical protein